VSASLGIVGLLLAAMGIYGVAAFAVAQRTREIGIRVALGAERGAVVRLVLQNAVSLTFAGCALGVTIAGLTHFTLTRVLFGFPAVDPPAFAAAIIIFVITGVAASYVPVRRALALDPIATLRYE
jgi:ABC-type antimicrobial peptide transport system permease subunit